jgi:small subunit ribosomal protein S9
MAEVFSATGRRKEAVCRLNLTPGKGLFSINGRDRDDYLCREVLVRHVMEPLAIVELEGKLDVSARVSGGGISGQAGAIRLALARALTEYDKETRAALKKGGFLTRDARRVERKKYGQPKARKRFQFSKR